MTLADFLENTVVPEGGSYRAYPLGKSQGGAHWDYTQETATDILAGLERKGWSPVSVRIYHNKIEVEWNHE